MDTTTKSPDFVEAYANRLVVEKGLVDCRIIASWVRSDRLVFDQQGEAVFQNEVQAAALTLPWESVKAAVIDLAREVIMRELYGGTIRVPERYPMDSSHGTDADRIEPLVVTLARMTEGVEITRPDAPETLAPATEKVQ
jgi:hypothetical protein